MLRSIVPTLETLRRKTIRSFAQRGIWGTLRRCIIRPWQLLWWRLRDLGPAQRRFRAKEGLFDARHQVNTAVQKDPGWMARVATPNWRHGIGYAPVPVHDMINLLCELDIDHERFVFIDLGAGKGRAVLMAAQFPFKRVIGVEYSPPLVEAMKRNIASYRNPWQRCFAVEGLLADATEYVLPHEPLALFFHHPFEEPIFRQVRRRIEQSLAECPRELLVIYYDPQCRAVFEESDQFRLLMHGESDRKYAKSADWVVYSALSPDL